MRLTTADATEAAGAALAAAVLRARPELLCIYLRGALGAGKSTFSRGFLRGLGHSGRVPSPTYTLVEPYEVGGYRVAHLDLYRLAGGAELEYLGIRELTEPPALLLVEWPERGSGFLPASDLDIELEVIPEGRRLRCTPRSAGGERLAGVLAGT